MNTFRARANATFRPLIDPALARTNNFGAVRLAFAVLVVFNHSYKLSDSGRDPISRGLGGQMDAGYMAVCCFFVISGFLVTKSWSNRHSTGDYLRKRCLRIYPGYLATVAICAFVVAPLASSRPLVWGSFLRGLAVRTPFFEPPFYDAAFFAHNPDHGILDGSLWSLKYEFLCYLAVLVVAALAVNVHKVIPLVVALVATVFVVLLRTASSVSNGVPVVVERGRLAHVLIGIFGNPGSWPGLLAFFFSGMSLYFYSDRIPRALAALIAAVGLIAGAAVLGQFAVVLPFFGTYVLFYAIYTRSAFNSVGTSVDLSYGIYLHSFWIQQALVAVFPAVFLHAPLPFFACALTLSVALAFLSWTYVEKPAQRIKFGFAPRRGGVADA